jgi:hypothetical protein
MSGQIKTTNYAINKGISWTEAQRIIQVCYTYILGTIFKDSFYILPIVVVVYVVAHIITTMYSTGSLFLHFNRKINIFSTYDNTCLS